MLHTHTFDLRDHPLEGGGGGAMVDLGGNYLSANLMGKNSYSGMDRKKYSESTLYLIKNYFCRKK